MSNKTLLTIVVIIVFLVIGGIVLTKNLQNSPSLSPTTQCSDRVDNDGDGRCDYSRTLGKRCFDDSVKGDSGCSNSSDNTEASCVVGSTTCGVGACQRTSTCVNDQVSCTPGTPSTEVCTDSIDNDCDGLTNEGCTQPDSCSDTDGGNVTTVTGTVSGYKSNVFYSNTDSCFTATFVTEFYCSGTNAKNNSIYCGLNKTCSSGRCV